MLRFIRRFGFLISLSAIVATTYGGLNRASAADLDASTIQTPAPTPPCQRSASSADLPQKTPDTLSRGDRINLAFYEILKPLEDRWGANRQQLEEPAKGVQLRAEFSHEYIVQENGNISIPILGVFDAENLEPGDLQSRIECAFDSFLGQKGFVNIVSVTKQPIYVVGKVKNAGSFAFAPGMTVLHAISLAGGFDNATLEPWQVVEISREAERIQAALDRAARMTARSYAIRAAVTGDTHTPQELADLVGNEDAKALLSQELEPRKMASQSLEIDLKSLQTEVEAATRDLELRKTRLPNIEQLIGLRQQRLADLGKLAQEGSLSRPVLIQAQTELMEVQDHQEETLAEIGIAGDRVNKARQALHERRDQSALLNEQGLLEARSEVAKAASEGESASQVLKTMAQTIIASHAFQDITYTIIRRSSGAPTEIKATEATLLEPGDLVVAKTDGAERAATAYNQN
jgi:polysaccharide biosynthesis/export protein ExoF